MGMYWTTRRTASSMGCMDWTVKLGNENGTGTQSKNANVLQDGWFAEELLALTSV